MHAWRGARVWSGETASDQVLDRFFSIPFIHPNRRSFYGDPIPGHVLAERLGTYTHLFNMYWCAVCMLCCGVLCCNAALRCMPCCLALWLHCALCLLPRMPCHLPTAPRALLVATPAHANVCLPGSARRSVRPFGVSTLLASYGKEGPQLYLVEPSGTMHVSWSGALVVALPAP